MELFTLVIGVLVTILSYLLIQAIYNFYFHPLAHIPGPWWVACSLVVKFHDKYGPLVRISPSDLHFNDPYFYEKVYCGPSQKRNKHKDRVRLVSAPSSLFSTVDQKLHRTRRSYLSGFFSKQAVARLEPFMHSKTTQLASRFKQMQQTGQSIDAYVTYGALTSDVISYYAYGESFDCISSPDFSNDFMRALSSLQFVSLTSYFFPWILDCMHRLPPRLVQLINPTIKSVFDLHDLVISYAVKSVNTPKRNDMKNESIFEALADPSIAEHERTVARLADEGLVVLGAGLETTARTLTVITYHLIANPDILAKMRTDPALPRENLPYLNAVINERLRTDAFIMQKGERVLIEPLMYNNILIPKGTIIGASSWLLNKNPEIFPEPHRFRPERWVEAQERGENLAKYLTTFSKGTRICLGINMAYAELYIAIVSLFRQFDLELAPGCSIEDIACDRDYGVGFTKNYKWGIRFRVAKVLDDQGKCMFGWMQGGVSIIQSYMIS
ncbi:benzoate 4-monooxygenase cytochrome P450 [Corynespora cassiicola Philippines]|uniref:Benzoate 4-monooxygenase cytochrome P450 n=1 Tax=Corynespora cassiicola Philippines TaxID=1448308 RepID=A0A2T2NRY6_CORCC|nr:benzoate 4-monooxygenase cytochrome P450 [Corynespora cassiicola Philippines]